MTQSRYQPRPSRAPHSIRRREGVCALALALAGILASPAALAQVDTDAIADLLTEQGSAGLGFLYRFEESPYIDAGQRSDLLPLYLAGLEAEIDLASTLGWAGIRRLVVHRNHTFKCSRYVDAFH